MVCVRGVLKLYLATTDCRESATSRQQDGSPVLTSSFVWGRLARGSNARHSGRLRPGLRLGRVDHGLFALDAGRLFGRSFLLNHLAAAFKHRALLDHQRRSLNVAVQLSGAAKFNALGGNDVAIDSALDRSDGHFDVRVNYAAGADYQRAGR